MDAKSVAKLVNELPHFIGMFRADELKNVKIISLPISLVVFEKNHWSSIIIDSESVQIMDSAGLLPTEELNEHFKSFICNNLYGKDLLATPQLQPDNSEACGMYAISFLYYYFIKKNDLVQFCKYFSTNFKKNDEIIRDIFKEVLRVKVILT